MPDLCPNCLQRSITADHNSRPRVVHLGSKESRLNPRLMTPLKYYVFENIMENGFLNSVQKLCGTGFSRFLLLYVILCSRSL